MTEESSGGSGGSDDHRVPRGGNRTLPGVLQYVAGVSPQAIGSVSSAPLEPERREFLASALQSLTSNHAETLQQLLNIIVDDSVELEAKRDALDELIDWCDDIDLGSDFLKMGGFDAVSPLVSADDADVRWRALELMATVLQNNPWAQDEARKRGWLKMFLSRLESDPSQPVRVKALYAVSCAVRGNDGNRKEFLDRHRGFDVLLRASQSEVEKIQIKSLFLMTAITRADPSAADSLCQMGMVEQLVGLAHQHSHDAALPSEDDDDAAPPSFLTEHVFSALLFFARSSPACRRECRRPDLPLRATLARRLQLVADDDRFEEERSCAKELSELVFGPVDEHEDDANGETDR